MAKTNSLEIVVELYYREVNNLHESIVSKDIDVHTAIPGLDVCVALHEDDDVATSTAESEIDRTALSKETSVPFWCTRSFDSIASSINVTEGNCRNTLTDQVAIHSMVSTFPARQSGISNSGTKLQANTRKLLSEHLNETQVHINYTLYIEN